MNIKKALSVFTASVCLLPLLPQHFVSAKSVAAKLKLKPVKHNLQQPYNPSKLQWLFVEFLSKDSVCFGTAQIPVASYRWKRPEQNDTNLTLYIFAENKMQLDSCTFSAFDELRNSSFEMKINPPKLRLARYLTDKQGNPNRGHKIYSCYIPKQVKDHRKSVQHDTAHDFGRLTKYCK
jgi:hypothetical protein